MRFYISLIFLCLVIVTACGKATPGTATMVEPTESTQTVQGSATQPGQATLTFTTDIPVELALRINGEGISLDDYRTEIQRLQAALTQLKQEMSEQDQKTTVINDLVGQYLLAQAAQKGGYQAVDSILQARTDALIKEQGGEEMFTAWMTQNYYTMDSFQHALKVAIEAAWQRDQIIALVPQKVEHIHARQILVTDENLGNGYLLDLQSGADFATLAYQVDPITGGDLGWFPKGYLTIPEVDEAVFKLQPGEFSNVIASKIGFHIVFVIDRVADYQLSPDALHAAQRKALKEWIEVQKSQAQIEILIP
jgi:peptidyl-prolyl cis-trans isomerase C